MSNLSYTYCLSAIAKVLNVIKVGKPITPSEINRAAGNGDYAAKYIMLMRKYYGFNITVQKDAKRVVSYTIVSEPKNVAELRAYTGREKAAKPTKTAKPTKAAKSVTVPAVATKTNTKVTAKAAAAKTASKPKKSPNIDPVKKTFGSTGEVATSYSVDPSWDSEGFWDESVLPKFLR